MGVMSNFSSHIYTIFVTAGRATCSRTLNKIYLSGVVSLYFLLGVPRRSYPVSSELLLKYSESLLVQCTGWHFNCALLLAKNKFPICVHLMIQHLMICVLLLYPIFGLIICTITFINLLLLLNNIITRHRDFMLTSRVAGCITLIKYKGAPQCIRLTKFLHFRVIVACQIW